MMRFGVMPLDFGSIMNAVIRGGTLDLSRFSFPEIVRHAVKRGFHHIEITLDLGYVIPGSLNETVVDELAKIGREEGVSYSVHLPLWSIEPASPNEYIRRASTESLINSIELAKPLQPESYVYHSTGALAAEFSRLSLPPIHRDLVNRGMASHSDRSVEELLSRTGIPPGKLALENVEFPFGLTRETVDRFDLSICFDTGHLLAGYCGEIPFMEFLERHFDRIVELHLHDGFHREAEQQVVRRDHLALGTGDLPITDLLGFLEGEGFDGPLVFELAFDETTKSLETIRRLCPNVAIE